MLSTRASSIRCCLLPAYLVTQVAQPLAELVQSVLDLPAQLTALVFAGLLPPLHAILHGGALVAQILQPRAEVLPLLAGARFQPVAELLYLLV